MTRWRPPAPRTAPYITAAGFRALEAEVKALWERRRDVVRHLAAAAAEGDRSENAEYQYRKKELREIDRRIGYLQRRMPQLKVVSERPADRSRVFFGAAVELEDASGAPRRFRIVGSDEAAPGTGAISLDSPVAQRLLGRALDDEVELDGLGHMLVTAIDYPDPCA
jgi:transcription elongation factor GreB